MNVKTLTIQLPDSASDWQGDTKAMQAYRVPAAAYGGGVTILEAWAVNASTTTSGTSHSFALLNYGTAGTAVKATGGTIGAAIGGTADVWTAGVPKDYTITAAAAYMAPGEYLVVLKDEDNSSDPSRATISINYVDGE